MSTIALPHAAATRTRALAGGRPGLVAVLALAAALCLWNLTVSGYSNEYYAAAARAASVNWKALFFGSLDPGSFITVDKPPLALWLQGLSARALGFSSFSILLPQALCTIASVGLLWATVRRIFGPVAATLAGAALALTPVTVAIARVNNPDALLVLLLVGSAYLMVRAIESGRTKHLVWCGVVVGLAFMTKMLQGWMVVPALGAAYLLAGPPALGTRVRQLALAAVAMVVASAAWPLAVTLWPGSVPYIGGSTDGSVWDLIFGYNGFGRIFGEGGAPGGGGGMGPTFGGLPGLWRLFNAQVGGQAAWLLPPAAVSLGAGLWLTRRAPRTDRERAFWILFGGWAVVHFVVFSFARGIFHPYYVSALAPAVAALCGAGAVTLWSWARRSRAGLVALDVALVLTAVVALRLLARVPGFAPALHTLIPVALAVALFATLALRMPGIFGRRTAAVAAVAAVLALGSAPAAYSVATAGHALNGNDVTAGPASVAGGMRGFGGGGMAGGGSVSDELVSYLQEHQGSAKYLVAASGSQSSAPLIIASGEPVVTIGGFNGGDPAPTVDQLEQLVADGELRYVLIGGGMGGGAGGPGGGSSAIQAWVQEHGTVVDGVDTGGATLYSLS